MADVTGEGRAWALAALPGLTHDATCSSRMTAPDGTCAPCDCLRTAGAGERGDALERWEGTDDAMYEVPGRRLREMSAEAMRLWRERNHLAECVEAKQSELRAEVDAWQREATAWMQERDEARTEAARLRERANAAECERDGLQVTINLMIDANRRGIARWQAATGRTDSWPDHAHLVDTLLAQLAARDEELAVAREDAERWRKILPHIEGLRVTLKLAGFEP